MSNVFSNTTWVVKDKILRNQWKINWMRVSCVILLSLGSSPSKLWCDSSILQVVGLHGYPGKSCRHVGARALRRMVCMLCHRNVGACCYDSLAHKACPYSLCVSGFLLWLIL